MDRRLAKLWGALFLLLLAACLNSQPDEKKSASSPGGSQATVEMRIMIRWSGDDFASRRDVETRSKIEALVEERGIGRVVRTGTGMGWMAVWVAVKDPIHARKALEELVKEAAPGVSFSVEEPKS